MTTDPVDRHDASPEPPPRPLVAKVLSSRNLTVASVIHSILFTGLMLCAFVIGKPQPATFVFGLSHGVMYMVMAAVCIVAARLRVISVTTALVVAVVGVVCPYFGTFELLKREQRRDEELAPEAG